MGSPLFYNIIKTLFNLIAVKYPVASCGVFDPCGSRQMDMQACPLGSLLAGIKWQWEYK